MPLSTDDFEAKIPEACKVLLHTKQYTRDEKNIEALAEALHTHFATSTDAELTSLKNTYEAKQEEILNKFILLNQTVRRYSSVTSIIYDALNIQETNLFENINSIEEIYKTLIAEQSGRAFERFFSGSGDSILKGLSIGVGIVGIELLLEGLAHCSDGLACTILKETTAGLAVNPALVFAVVMTIIAVPIVIKAIDEFIYKPYQLNCFREKLRGIFGIKDLRETRNDLYYAEFMHHLVLQIQQLRADAILQKFPAPRLAI